jgi:hypothetical protein
MGAADDDAELTREDKLRLKALLRLLDKAATALPVDPPAVRRVRPSRQSLTAEEKAEVEARVNKALRRHGATR